MARKAGQLISRVARTWLVRVSLGRDPEAGTRKYHNRTVHGSFREVQTYLNTKLQERNIGRLPRVAAIRLDDYLDQWLATSAKPRLRPKSYIDYKGLLRLHIRPSLGARPNRDYKRDGKSLLGWEPFVSYNNRNLRHKVIRVEEYRIGISMFCNESWLAGKRSKERLAAFVDRFVAGWNSYRFIKFEATLDLTLSPETRQSLLVSVSPDKTEGLARLVSGATRSSLILNDCRLESASPRSQQLLNEPYPPAHDGSSAYLSEFRGRLCSLLHHPADEPNNQTNHNNGSY